MHTCKMWSQQHIDEVFCDAFQDAQKSLYIKKFLGEFVYTEIIVKVLSTNKKQTEKCT